MRRSPRSESKARPSRAVLPRGQARPPPPRRGRFRTRCSSGVGVASAYRWLVRPAQARARRGLAQAARCRRPWRASGGGVPEPGSLRPLRPLRPLRASRPRRPAGAAVLPPGTRSRPRRPRRTPRRRWCVRPPAKRRSRSWLRRPERVSGSASSGRRWCPQPAPPSGISSSPTPTRRRSGSACPSRRGRRPSPRRAPRGRGAPSRRTCRPKAGRNRPKRPRTALSRSRRWSGGGSSTHRPARGRRKR